MCAGAWTRRDVTLPPQRIIGMANTPTMTTTTKTMMMRNECSYRNDNNDHNSHAHHHAHDHACVVLDPYLARILSLDQPSIHQQSCDVVVDDVVDYDVLVNLARQCERALVWHDDHHNNNNNNNNNNDHGSDHHSSIPHNGVDPYQTLLAPQQLPLPPLPLPPHHLTTVAALVAFNQLEDTIAHYYGHGRFTVSSRIVAGRAPLLTHMLSNLQQQVKQQQHQLKQQEQQQVKQQLVKQQQHTDPPFTKNPADTDPFHQTHVTVTVSVASLVPLLRCLLLPGSAKNCSKNGNNSSNSSSSSSGGGGLNLRNLVWHGFVGRLDRAWLALIMVLHQQLQVHLQRRMTLQQQQQQQKQQQQEEAEEKDKGAAIAETKAPLASSPPPTMTSSSSSSFSLDPFFPAARQSLIRARGQALWEQPRTLTQHIAAWIGNQDHIVGLWNVAMEWIERDDGDDDDDDDDANSHQYQKFPRRRHQQQATESPCSEAPCLDAPLDSSSGVSCRDVFPVTLICAMFTVLLEHGLRQDWCRCNHRARDAVARPGAYYVTLDGHGQRHQHNLLLFPYVLVDNDDDDKEHEEGKWNEERNIVAIDQQSAPASPFSASDNKNDASSPPVNQLMYQLGAPLTSLLSDLFVSPYGPNLRAALAHGSLNDLLEEELAVQIALANRSSGPESAVSTTSTAPTKERASNRAILRDYAKLLLFAMDQAATASLAQPDQRHQSTDNSDGQQQSDQSWSYRPMFSFAADTRLSLGRLQSGLRQLDVLVQQGDDVSGDSNPSVAFGTSLDLLSVPFCQVHGCLERLALHMGQPLHSDDSDIAGIDTAHSWTVADILREHECNQRLAPLGATRTLVKDVATAITNYLETRHDFASELHSIHTTTATTHDSSRNSAVERRRRRTLRLVECGRAAWQMYTFAAWVALLSLERSFSMYHETGTENNSFPLDGSQLKKAVERTRMVVSTVDTFLTTNSERAFKSVAEYTKSKQIKSLIAFKQEQNKDCDPAPVNRLGQSNLWKEG